MTAEERRRWGKAGMRLTDAEAAAIDAYSRGVADFGGYSMERGCDQ